MHIRKPDGKKPSYKPSWAWKPEAYHRHCDTYRIEVRYNEFKRKGGVYDFQVVWFYSLAAAQRFAARNKGRVIFK